MMYFPYITCFNNDTYLPTHSFADKMVMNSGNCQQ